MDMKSLFTRIVTVAVAIAATSLSAFSQTRVVEHDLSPFEAIEAENGFKVSIVKSDLYGIKLTVDDALESYVECYVKAGTLHISMDEKSIPKDVKKLYKGRNSGDPTLVAVVYMPTLKSLTLSDNSEFYNSGNLSGDSFNLTMGGSSKTSDLRIVSKNVSVSVGKNAKLSNANITAEGDLTVAVDGKSVTSITCAAENLSLTIAGSSEININGAIEKKATVATAGSAKATMSGSAEDLEINGKSTSCKVDASLLKVENALVAVTGTFVDIAPAKTLELDLGKASEVSYSGDPAVKIVKIQNSSVLRK